MKLPKVNDLGFFEIRLESIGGLGANGAGKMIAEVGVLSQGYNGAAFSSYGSEKKGSPIKSFVRFADNKTKVRVNSTIEEPQIIAVFHMNLLKIPTTLMGVKPDAVVVLNTSMGSDDARDFAKLHAGTLVCIDATKIALEEKLPATNTIMMGAMLNYMPFLDKTIFESVIRKQFASKPHLIEQNVRAFKRGMEEGVEKVFKADKKYPYIPYKKPDPKYGKLTQPMGGVIVEAGNSALKDLSVTRTGRIPIFNEKACINCGQCDIVCPDMAIHFEKRSDGKMYMEGVDYQYCKGCLKCVEICPTRKKENKEDHALSVGVEADYDIKSITKPHYKFQK